MCNITPTQKKHVVCSCEAESRGEEKRTHEGVCVCEVKHPSASAIPVQIHAVAPGTPGPATALEQRSRTCLLHVSAACLLILISKEAILSSCANWVSQWAADFFEVTVGKYA